MNANEDNLRFLAPWNEGLYGPRPMCFREMRAYVEASRLRHAAFLKQWRAELEAELKASGAVPGKAELPDGP